LNQSETEELISVLRVLGGVCEDLSQRLAALVGVLSPVDRQRYDKELKRLEGRGNLTNAALAVATLEEKILPPDQS
jgi:hypothetical protein